MQAVLAKTPWSPPLWSQWVKKVLMDFTSGSLLLEPLVPAGQTCTTKPLLTPSRPSGSHRSDKASISEEQKSSIVLFQRPHRARGPGLPQSVQKTQDGEKRDDKSSLKCGEPGK